MAWRQFPFPQDVYRHTPASLQQAWPRLHAGDVEVFPADPALLRAWIAFHAGEFELAARLGLELGIAGYSVAHKATCVHATCLETSDKARFAAFEQIAARCEDQQLEQPDNPAAFYWHAYSLGRYAQGISVVKALSQGLGAKIYNSLEMTLRLAPGHADAHVAFGVYHAEIIDKVGSMMGKLTYGAKKADGVAHFKTAIALNPGTAIGRIEYANALMLLEGRKKMAQALALYEEAGACDAMDASERLHVEAALDELKDYR